MTGLLLTAIHNPRCFVPQAETTKCGRIWEQYGIQRIEAFLQVLETINNDDTILDHIRLGCDIRDTCWYSPKALDESKDFIRNALYTNRVCDQENVTKPVAGETLLLDCCMIAD